MSVVDDLRSQISAGRITFDPPAARSAKLRRELLGENAGTKVTGLLQELVLEVSRRSRIRISSIVRSEGHHGRGRAFDVGNEEIAAALLPGIATDAQVRDLHIDELIFDATVAGQDDRNEWNYDQGQKHNYNGTTLNDHRNHIHFAVKAS
ncbi:MAG: hypothetical protein QOG71_2970 [Pyrinomonadaceae bacterium]|nr:hypothetical protein [Pyrinomonadaceae bacterium]